MSSSLQKSLEIGQCPICLSNLNKSNIYTISKCGHTFHHLCIFPWISIAKNCPTCRTNAVQSDIIKLFIQKNEVENAILQEVEILPYTETKRNNYYRRIMTVCQCEIIRYEIGYFQYKCLKNFNVQIYSLYRTDKIQINLTDEILVTIHSSRLLEILREKTEEKSIVNSKGERFEYFYQGMQNWQKKFLVESQNKGTFRSNEDYVRQDVKCIQFCFPKFTIKRSFKNSENGKVTVSVYTNDPDKSLKIKICPGHQSFYVEHLYEKKITRCTNSEFLCVHLQE
uniref:RING-type domain-containing protein n=1 Tax=Panagrolaimus sp. PS1159 TaxID=55785 RepID=A0AC35GYG0_9BILA